ncbi:unnamed protein product [Medioppia subpectinata]|uniref:Glutathione S-transferase n=1 Tax=Medioppia subpectinata TaxID=1979941 RepID=A0A7R9KRM1_9ACAR|nr:unnamed protein product [Medioppia subpectinata]CAG2108092.1 unnamed protein product [Medioppia subpectinata]
MSVDIYSFKFSPFCRTVLMTARELNIDLNVIETDPGADQTLTPEYIKMNPVHSLPTLNDNGFILWESRAIMQYLCNRYAPDSTLYPKEPKKRALVDRWLNFDMSFVESAKYGIMMKAFGGVDPPEEKVIAYKNLLKQLDQLIGDNKYLVGDHLTIADIAVLVTSSMLLMVNYDLTDYPNLGRWLRTLTTELPYFAEINIFPKEDMDKWVARSGHYLKRKIL